MPFKTGSPREVLNFDAWLPADGEDRVDFHSEGLDVVVRVQFDADVARGAQLNC